MAPKDHDILPDKSFVSRREFMEWMGGLTTVLAGTGCTKQPRELILPYAKMPEQMVPGVPLFYASTVQSAGDTIGILVESHMGRPTKIEGNPDHPASLGATDAITQATVLDLYDPDRLQVPKFQGVTATWDNFEQVVAAQLAKEKARAGKGLRILTETVTSPTLAAQIGEVLKLYPQAKWVQYEPIHRDEVWEGTRLAFGRALSPRYDFARADRVVSFDCDFMGAGPGHVRYAREFAARRNTSEGTFNRFFAFEITPTLSGNLADHRLPITPDEMKETILWVARRVGISGIAETTLSDTIRPYAEIVARELMNHRGKSLVLAGDYLPPSLQAVVHAINHSLGNVGNTVTWHDAVQSNTASQMEALRGLVDDMAQGAVSTLFILEGNPVFTAPADLDFAGELKRVELAVHHTLLESETSAACQWQIPATHYLEHWSDARAYDGTRSLVQPLISPLYAGKSSHEIVSLLVGRPRESGHSILRQHWKSILKGDFEKAWKKLLHDGLVAGDRSGPVAVRLQPVANWKLSAGGGAARPSLGISLVLRPDPCLWDGRYANNGWLQELPKPITKTTWDNTFQLPPALAAELKVEEGDVIEVQSGPFKVSGAVLLLPGQARRTLVAHLGYGRTKVGRVGNGFGFDAYALFTSKFSWSVPAVTVTKLNKKMRIATTQGHFKMEGRDLVRSYFVSEVQKIAPPKSHGAHASETKTPAGRPFTDENYAWAMAINLASCNGCNACVVACQAENNVAVVGKDEVLRGRELHWLRVDRYYEGNPENPEVFSQPVPCMHCEQAPCEVVCPVAATTHSPEGLNEMTYNRCVGTKYCSNNCPYKVRRFNFYHYSDIETPSLQLGRNPDVTVRARGVMEKCTFCVQRINSARIDAKREDRLVRDGEIVPACASACPTQAISFGNIKDHESEVSKLKSRKTNYALLEELGTKPRTTYLAHVSNPSEEWLSLGSRRRTQPHE